MPPAIVNKLQIQNKLQVRNLKSDRIKELMETYAEVLYYKCQENPNKEEAIKCYSEVIEIVPNHINALNKKGLALHYSHKYEEAIKCYDKAIQIDPTRANTWYSRACLKVKKGDIENGIADLKKAIQIGGNHYINLAKEDVAFETMRNDEHFNSLLIM